MFKFVAFLASATADETSSLLQMKVKESGALQMMEAVKTVTFSNATKASCSCAWVGCPLVACAPCPEIACDCFCAQGMECHSCCNGDLACLAKKLRAVTADRIERIEAEENYRRDVDKYDRKHEEKKQEEINSVWSQMKADRRAEEKRQQEANKAWREAKKSHREMEREQKERRGRFKEWKADLSDEAERVHHLTYNGETLKIRVHTADVHAANSDGSIQFRACSGEDHCSDWQGLDNKLVNDFERGDWNEFDLAVPTLDPKSIEISTAHHDGWLMDGLEIQIHDSWVPQKTTPVWFDSPCTADEHDGVPCVDHQSYPILWFAIPEPILPVCDCPKPPPCPPFPGCPKCDFMGCPPCAPCNNFGVCDTCHEDEAMETVIGEHLG